MNKIEYWIKATFNMLNKKLYLLKLKKKFFFLFLKFIFSKNVLDL
jgi:hypothetical protein